MFGDIGWTELVLIGIVALIVIGPEDLPDMFRQVGRFTAKLRQMSREFSRAMEQAAKDSGVKDVAADLKAVTSPTSLGLSKVKEAADRFEKWDPMKPVVKPAVTVMPSVTAVAEPTIRGPETQALMDKQAAKKAILAETTAKLKAVDAPILVDVVPSVPKPAAAPRAKKVSAGVVAEVAATPEAKPRAPRKAKKADEA